MGTRTTSGGAPGPELAEEARYRARTFNPHRGSAAGWATSPTGRCSLRPTGHPGGDGFTRCQELDGAGVRSVTGSGWTVDQTSHRLVCDALRRILHQAAQASPGAAERVDSMLCRVSAVLYLLLLDHPIDRRGRCRSCRRPGARIALRRRSCLIHLRANYWLLRQPDKAMLLAHLGDHLGLDHASVPPATTPPDRSSSTMTALIDPRDTDVLPTAVSDVADPPQTPTVPPTLSPRRFPDDGQPPCPGSSLVTTGGMPWPR